MNVTYFLHTKDNTKKKKYTNICFAGLTDIVRTFKPDDYITYTLEKCPFSKEEILVYLSFMKRIKPFNRLLKNINNIAETKSVTIPLNITAVELKTILTIVRALEESTPLVKYIIKINENWNGIPYTPLQIIKILSLDDNVYGSGHWFCSNADDDYYNEYLNSPLDLSIYNYKQTIFESSGQGMNKLFKYKVCFGKYTKHKNEFERLKEYLV